MREQQITRETVARVLAKVADALDADQPNSKMTNAARLGRISLFTPGQPDLFDVALMAAPAIDPQITRGEYAAQLRAVAA